MVDHVSPNTTTTLILNTSTSLLKTISRDPLKTLFPILNLIVAIAILGVNTPILFLAFSKPKLLRSVSNKILLSLVVSDILTGIMVLFVLLPYVFHRLYGIIGYKVFLDIGTLWLQLSLMSNLSFIIFERYYSVVHPYTVGVYFSSYNVVRGIKILWVATFAYPCVQLLWLYKVIDGYISPTEDIYVKQADSIFSAVSAVLFFVIPVLILAVLFVRMYREIQKIPISDNTKKRKGHKRVLNTFVLMYFLYVILTVPYFVIRLLFDFGNMSNFKIPYYIVNTTYILKLLPPVIDPFVYIFKKPDFKRELLAKSDELKELFNSAGVWEGRRPENHELNNNMNSETNF